MEYYHQTCKLHYYRTINSRQLLNKEKRRQFNYTPLQINEINQSTRLFDLSWPVIALSSVANLSYSALFWDACFLRMSVWHRNRYERVREHARGQRNRKEEHTEITLGLLCLF